jgi:hypothetical protein
MTMAAKTRGRRCRPHYRSPFWFGTEEALREHRELEYLRALGESRHGKAHTRRVRERARKLDRVGCDFRSRKEVTNACSAAR